MPFRLATPEETKEYEARAQAMREERARVETERRKRTFVVVSLFLIVFAVVMFTVIGPLLGLAKVAAPLACPSGYERAYVEHWTESVNGGRPSSHWKLHCVTPAGDVQGDDGTVYFMSGALGFAMSMSAFVTLLVMRRKRTPF